MAEKAQNSVSAGTASDVRTFLVAALLTDACGMLVFVSYAMLGGGGVILGLIAAAVAVLFWRSSQNQKVFPRNPSTRSVVILALVAAVLTVVAVALTS